MKLFDALKKSIVKCAIRTCSDGDGYDGEEPNIVIIDTGHQPFKIKAFRSVDRYAWERRKLKDANKYNDWQPANKIPMEGSVEET